MTWLAIPAAHGVAWQRISTAGIHLDESGGCSRSLRLGGRWLRRSQTSRTVLVLDPYTDRSVPATRAKPKTRSGQRRKRIREKRPGLPPTGPSAAVSWRGR